MLLLTHIYEDGTYRLTNTETHETNQITRQSLEAMHIPIVGVFRNPDMSIFDIHKVSSAVDYGNELDIIIDNIKTPELKMFASVCKRIIPSYFFSVPASTSGKFHPASNIGQGGLVRHTLFVCENLLYITGVESTIRMLGYTQEEIDCMLIACMMHDSLKDGWNCKVNGETIEYDKDEGKDVYTLHPLNAAKAIRGMIGFADMKYLDFIAHCIESHMGSNPEWHMDERLPAPSDKYQWLVHICDYMASRRDISMEVKGTSFVKYGSPIKYVNPRNPASAPWDVLKDAPKIEIVKNTLKQEEINAINTVANIPTIAPSIMLACGIDADTSIDKIKSIWQSVLKSGSASERQQKYVNLAVAIVKNS